ncbi:MAG TPA: winged helix-turn-helix domain-containing protein [Gemmataceae bacterium]|nr:winged helix-turn-helix domain-containing protein [Gemmataceae bacterium]
MSAKNKGAKGAKAKQRAEKAKPAAATKLIPELAAMKFPAKMVAKLEALAEADQDTVLNYVNSGMKINDAYQRTTAGKPEQQQAEPEAATPAPEVASPEAGSAGQAAAQATPEATPGADTTSAAEGTQAGPGTQPEAKKRGRAPKAKAETGPKKLSAIDAAAKVLAEAGEPMDCQTMIKTMAEKGYWMSAGGKTPAATLYSAILRELQTKGHDSRFKKTERGKFGVGKAS